MNTLSFDECFVREEGGCWIWQRARTGNGYGVLRGVAAHRYSYERAHGPIPRGLFVLHRCDDRRCVNPSHLFLGSHADNMRDMAAKGRTWQQQRTHCPRGHEYAGENLHMGPKGVRRCRACSRHWSFLRYHRLRANVQADAQ